MEIKNLIRVYENALDEQFCDKIIRQFKRDRKLQTGPGGQKLGDTYIGSPDSKWTELRIDDLAKWDPIRQKLVESCQVHSQKYIDNVEGYLPERAALETFRLKWYRISKKEQFGPHIDVDCLERSNRCLAFLWYLNDVSRGGETNFMTLDHKVPAKKGNLLIFPPFWMYPHAGEAPETNDKYIISTFMKFAA